MGRRVVVAGWGQITQRKEQKERLLEPVGLMRECSLLAGDLAGDRELVEKIDGIMTPRIMSCCYPNSADLLARELGASSRFKFVSKIGGNSPQSLVNKAAGMIARGELDSVLISGAETFYPRSKAACGSQNRLLGPADQEITDDMIGSTKLEESHGLTLPIHGFPLYETAFWAESGLDKEAYFAKVGTSWAEFNEAAVNNPYAWTQTPLTGREIVTPGPTNRYIVFPYTLYMTSLLTADLGSAILLMSEEKARRTAPGGRNTVYFMGGGYAEDRQRFFIHKTNFTTSPPMKAAAEKALNRSRLSIDEIRCFDLYSCFPCAVTMARRMIGISPTDPRPQTLTGGLGFFGAPANNYTTHAIASLAEEIASGRKENGMVTALGWFMHKHAAGVYGAEPPDTALDTHDLEDDKAFLAGADPVEADPTPRGKGMIDTYSIPFSRDGSPLYAIVYGKTEAGKRFVANTPPDPDMFRRLCTENQVGRAVRLTHDARENRNIAELLE
ncbi:MAG: hypothetical protein HY788_23300 [Deltaproteobacteria bacterium]|nr:hypothetical protein [Deltaproteobacteria bacterium]